MAKDPTLSLYDYPLPWEFIAQHPLPKRDASRLLVLHRRTSQLEHRTFRDILHYLHQGDALVLNDSRVIPARLVGKRPTGGWVKLLLVEELHPGRWKVLLEASGKPKIGEEIDLEEGAFHGILLSREDYRYWVIDLEPKDTFWETLFKVGRMPLPPYIKRPPNKDPFFLEDKKRYQSVFATRDGSIAAPTAGLHFTKDLLEEIAQRGVEILYVTLHVGLGTFTPISSEDISQHVMQREYYELGMDTARRLKEVKERGNRVIAAGSTCCRVLETVAQRGEIAPSKDWTELFIRPPFQFMVVDGLLTNFHLPKTPLLVLVSAFAGRENILKAYSVAKKAGYRFYSYGDAMLIL